MEGGKRCKRLSGRGRLDASLGTLRSDNEKQTLRPLKLFRPIFQVTQLLESSEVRLELRKIGDRGRVQRYLAVLVLKSTQNLVISWRKRATTAKKPDARQSICFVHKTYCVLDVPVAVAVVVLKGPFFLARRRIILLRALTVAFCLSRPIKPCFYWVYPRTSLTVASIATVASNKQLLFKTKESCLKFSKIIKR